MCYDSPPERIVLDLDATDDPVHGDQLGKFFHGYYGHYCYYAELNVMLSNGGRGRFHTANED